MQRNPRSIHLPQVGRVKSHLTRRREQLTQGRRRSSGCLRDPKRFIIVSLSVRALKLQLALTQCGTPSVLKFILPFNVSMLH